MISIYWITTAAINHWQAGFPSKRNMMVSWQDIVFFWFFWCSLEIQMKKHMIRYELLHLGVIPKDLTSIFGTITPTWSALKLTVSSSHEPRRVWTKSNASKRPKPSQATNQQTPQTLPMPRKGLPTAFTVRHDVSLTIDSWFDSTPSNFCI